MGKPAKGEGWLVVSSWLGLNGHLDSTVSLDLKGTCAMNLVTGEVRCGTMEVPGAPAAPVDRMGLVRALRRMARAIERRETVLARQDNEVSRHG